MLAGTLMVVVYELEKEIDMKIIDAGFEILTPISKGGISELQFLEKIARKCYKSEDKISEDGESAKSLVGSLIKSKHEAMLEHMSLSVLFICDRGVSHEIVRHRMASFAQESTRYCNYSKGKFGSEVTFIRPYNMPDDSVEFGIWESTMLIAESSYIELIKNGISPQMARSVLPNSLKTELIMTANLREWRHFLKLRAAGSTGAPHPQMLEITVPLLIKLQHAIPVVFDDIIPYKK